MKITWGENKKKEFNDTVIIILGLLGIAALVIAGTLLGMF